LARDFQSGNECFLETVGSIGLIAQEPVSGLPHSRAVLFHNYLPINHLQAPLEPSALVPHRVPSGESRNAALGQRSSASMAFGAVQARLKISQSSRHYNSRLIVMFYYRKSEIMPHELSFGEMLLCSGLIAPGPGKNMCGNSAASCCDESCGIRKSHNFFYHLKFYLKRFARVGKILYCHLNLSGNGGRK
jgi:hypothetical protein